MCEAMTMFPEALRERELYIYSKWDEKERRRVEKRNRIYREVMESDECEKESREVKEKDQIGYTGVQ